MDFADDIYIALTSDTKAQIQKNVLNLNINSKAAGLKIISEKTKLFRLNEISNEKV